jgi:hypothetical protein
MKHELQDLLHRWHTGALSEDELRRLTALLDTPEARAALHDEWFLDAALPEALQAVPAWNLTRPAAALPTRTIVPIAWSWTPAHWSALGAAAVVSIACLVWERIGSPPEEFEVFAAQIAAAALEP